MLEQLGYVKETITLRENDITANEFETNNLLMDDILLALGYNKRRDRGIRGVYSSGADWEISINGDNRFIVSVYGYKSDEPTNEQLVDTFTFADSGVYHFVVVTDGERLTIYKDAIKIVSLESIFDDSSDDVLKALSKTGWNPLFIEKYRINSLLTGEIIHKALKNDIEGLIDIIEANGNIITIEAIFARVAEFIDEKEYLNYLDTSELDSETGEEYVDITAPLLVQTLETDEKIKEEIKQLQERLDTVIAERDTLVAERDALNLNNEVTEDYSSILKEKNELSEEVNMLQDKLKQAELRDVEQSENYEKLSVEHSMTAEKLSSTEEALAEANRATEVLKATLDDANSKLTELEENNNKKDKIIKELEEKIEELNKADTETFKDENEYRDKISELTTENQLLKAELTEHKNKLDEIRRKQESAEDERVVLSRQLLEAIEDNPDMERTYVGVVNTKLFQIAELPKFVGACLQELYSAVSFELMQLLFDGDIFSIRNVNHQGDLMLNAKNYVLEFGELSEDEILSRLNTLFSKFNNVVFNYKVIGNKEIKKTKINLVKESDTVFMSTFGVTEEDTFEEPEVIVENIDRKLLGLAMVDIGSILWSEGNPIKTIAAIGDDYKLFNVDSYNKEKMVDDAVKSLISISSSVQMSIKTLRESDLTKLSALIHNGKQSETDIRILDTTYYIEDTSTEKIISVILSIAERLNIESQQAYMYFEADYVEDWHDFYAMESSLGLKNKFNRDEIEDSDEVLHCILSGTVVDFIQSLDGVLEAEKELIDGTLAVRTRYMQKSLRSVVDVGAILSEILAKSDNPVEVINKINSSNIYDGNLILNEDEVAGIDVTELGTVSIGDAQYFVTKIPAYAVVLMVMMAHKEVTGDSIIDIRLALNSKLYYAYNSGISTSDSGEYMISKLLIDVTNGKVRSINK